MELTYLHIKNFRCFDQVTFALEQSLILIEGANGSGKTTILEAIHYACYIRSFRTYYPAQLIRSDQENFFIKIRFSQEGDHRELHVGFAEKRRLIKIDQRPVSTYKQVLDHYRVITVTEDDLYLIQGPPEIRRRFLDSFLMLQNPDYLVVLKKLKTVIDNRNSLLKKEVSRNGSTIDEASHAIWTEQLIAYSTLIQDYRKQALQQLQEQVNVLLHTYIDPELNVYLNYEQKQYKADTLILEKRVGRTLFGAHVDDFSLQFRQKSLRLFASRGQQKLIMMLLKVAQVEQLRHTKGAVILAIDDFMTDFDERHTNALLQVLYNTHSQLILTCPLQNSFFKQQFLKKDPQHILLTH